MNKAFHFLLLSLLISTTLGLHAQDSGITPAELEVEEPEEMIEILKLEDDSALQVIKMLEQWSGKIILRRQDISPAKISIDSRGPISKRDAVLALESLLTLNGIMLTDMGGRFMKAVPATDVNRHVPQMIIGSTLELDASQQIYAKLFKFDYLNAEQVSGTLIQPLLSQNSGFIPFPKSNALLITDALVNLQRVESILAEADQPEALREEMKFIKLDFIQATEALGQIENLIQGPLKSYLEGNTAVTADERTNQLILVTHPGNVPMIMDVIDNIDVDAAPLTSSEVFQLRQAKAEEVVPIIENIIQGQREGREKDAEVARKNETKSNGNNQNNAQKGIPNPANNAATPTKTTSGSGGGESNASLQFSNFVGLSADERTNAIVAYGTHQDLKTLKELIEKIDIPLPQVLIEAVITEVTLRDGQASGLSSFGFTYDALGSLGTGTAITNDVFSDINIASAGIGLSNGLFVGSDPENFSLTALVTASDSDSDSKILSTPQIVVSHNEEGLINVSESRPIITSSLSSGVSTSLNTRSSVEFRDIGIKLTVTPLIGSDGTVQMSIEQTVENVVGTIDIDDNAQPIIGKREATSTISVKDGQVIVLGGLQQNSRTDGESYYPLIRWVPFIGERLGGKNQDYNRTELIIFIRPTILLNPAAASATSEKKIEKAKESEVLKDYFKNETLGNTYMEGSAFEEDKPAFRLKWPNL